MHERLTISSSPTGHARSAPCGTAASPPSATITSGVEGLTERGWEGRQLTAGQAVIALADLRGRCITTTWHPDTITQDVDVLRHIRTAFDGTLALNAWAGREGNVAIDDGVELLEAPIELTTPAAGRFN